MNDVNYMAGSAGGIRVQLDQKIMRSLVEGDGSGDEREQNLREHQVYLLMRSVVSQFNERMKGRRERFKLIDEGDGLIIEFG